MHCGKLCFCKLNIQTNRVRTDTQWIRLASLAQFEIKSLYESMLATALWPENKEIVLKMDIEH